MQSCDASSDKIKTVAGGGIKAAKALSPSSKRPAEKGLIAAAKDQAGAASSSSAASGAGTASGSGAAAAKKRQPLHKPDIYVRIRPLATEGGHAEDGTKLTKHLDAWDETSVTIETQYLFSKGEAKYSYPKRVFGTEATNLEVTDAIVPDLVESFVTDRTSVLFFAYGQTGTGKTRTMLGTEPSLTSAEPHEDWGVFPRVCTASLEKLTAMRQSGIKCRLSASAIEFYLGECFDLLSSSARYGNAPVLIDPLTHEPSGESCVPLEQPSDLLAFVAQVIANRTSRGTNFNQTSAEHSGSSRSHAALILTLMTLDAKTREYVKSTFTLVDLAGAERPDKVKEESKNAGGDPKMAGMAPEFITSLVQAVENGSMTRKQFNKMLPLNFQTRLINFELFALGSEVLKATQCHQGGKPFDLTPMATPTIKYLSAILDGKARLAMCVTLSPAGRNAWETWFSLQYGQDLAKLHAPRRRDKAQDMDKLLKTKSKEAAALRKDVDGMAKDHRYYAQKLHKTTTLEELVRRLELLVAEGGGGSSTAASHSRATRCGLGEGRDVPC